MSNIEKDIEIYLHDLDTIRNKHDLVKEADVLQKIGFAYKSLNKYPESRQYFILAQEILRKIGHGEQAVALQNQIETLDELMGTRKITPLALTLMIVSVLIALIMAISLLFLGLDFFAQNLGIALTGLGISLIFGVLSIYIGRGKRKNEKEM
jgi:tetratricopeptide (TPR) repeat protein